MKTLWMDRRAFAALAGAGALALLGNAAFAQDAGGVKFDPAARVAGKDLKLNGTGLRTRLSVRVYAMGLYLPEKTESAAEAINQANRNFKRHFPRVGTVLPVLWAVNRALPGDQSPLALTIRTRLRAGSPFTRLALGPSRDHGPSTSVGSLAEPSSCSPVRLRRRARTPAPLRAAAPAPAGPGA